MARPADPKEPDGPTERDHLEAAARMGSESAKRDLEEPECPDELWYLVEWAFSLFGRSGEGFTGIAKLSNREIESWANLREIVLHPFEVEALLAFDDARCSPDPSKEEEEDTEVNEPSIDPWPTRRTEPVLLLRSD